MTAAETRTRSPELDEAFDAELEAMALEAAAPPVEEPREAGLPRYAKWQALDFLKYRAVIILPLAMIALWIFHHNYDVAKVGAEIGQGRNREFSTEAAVFRTIVMAGGLAIGALGSLLATFGLVSRDREGGHQRFLFAKPIRITSYYLQAFALNGIGLLAVTGLTLAITSAVFLRPVPFLEPLLGAAITYVAVGGLTFLLSTLIRADLAVAALLAVLSFPLHQAARQGRWWAVLTSWLLPPLENLGAFLPVHYPEKPAIITAIGSLLTYGAAYVAAGVAVLKRRSIIR